MRPGRLVEIVLAVGALAFLLVVPELGWDVPFLFDDVLNSPGTLQLLALCLVFGGVAVTYDLLFGTTGLLSFGHALPFALGAYMLSMGLSTWGWSFEKSLVVAAIVGLVSPVVIGAVSLRVSGIAFAMVTLAFAQAAVILIEKNPGGRTGGNEGLALAWERLPEQLVGVFNTKNLYWIALGYAVVVFLVTRWAIASSPGHVWTAIRENPQRVEVLGLRPYPYKLLAFVLASFLATAGGVAYVLLVGGANPAIAGANLTLSLLVMVVIGGSDTRWGPLLGGILYTYLDQRLQGLATNERVQDLPEGLRIPLSEPLFVLGTLFVLFVLFAPGGLAGVVRLGRPQRVRRQLERAARQTAAPGIPAEPAARQPAP